MAIQVYVFGVGEQRPTRVDASGVVAGSPALEIYAYEDITSSRPVRKTVAEANSAGDFVYIADENTGLGRVDITTLAI